jgi:hypothetical protein
MLLFFKKCPVDQTLGSTTPAIRPQLPTIALHCCSSSTSDASCNANGHSLEMATRSKVNGQGPVYKEMDKVKNAFWCLVFIVRHAPNASVRARVV